MTLTVQITGNLTLARTRRSSHERALSPAIARSTKSAREFLTRGVQAKNICVVSQPHISLEIAASLLLVSNAHRFIDSATLSSVRVGFERRRSIVLEA